MLDVKSDLFEGKCLMDCPLGVIVPEVILEIEGSIGAALT